MGFYAGYALSLYGRAFDGLYHVLVSPPYENLPDFFYPAQQSPECLNIRNVRLAACDAEIMLADIPFVRMGNDPASNRGSYMSAVREAQNHQPMPAALMFDESRRTVVAGGVTIKFPPLLLPSISGSPCGQKMASRPVVPERMFLLRSFLGYTAAYLEVRRPTMSMPAALCRETRISFLIFKKSGR